MSTPPPFRDIKKAEKSGIIIAPDPICKYCKSIADASSDEDGTHRKCREDEVIKTGHAMVESNRQVIESNKELGAIITHLNDAVQKLAALPSGMMAVTVSPAVDPSPAKNPYMEKRRRSRP